MPRINNIIIMRLSAMGDVAMIVPIIRTLTQQYPTLRLTVVSRPFFKPFFEDMTQVYFFGIDLKKRHRGFLGLFRLFNDLSRLEVDAFADLHDVLRSKIIRNLFLVKGVSVASLDKGRDEKKKIIRKKNKIFRPLKTMVERYTEVFEALGFSVSLENPVFPPKQRLGRKILEIVGAKNQKWVGIAPFAQHVSKVYPVDLMAEVINILAKDKGCKLFLFGGGEREIILLDRLSEDKDNVINIAGKIPFKQELELISHLDIMVTMDSANAHIAAMMGIEVITLWGATHPFLGFSPFNQPLENGITADREKYPMLPTSVYGNKIIPGYEEAMRTIMPEKVVNIIRYKLSFEKILY